MGLMRGHQRRKQQGWFPQPLAPLMEGPDPETQEDGLLKKESSWDSIRDWFRPHPKLGFPSTTTVHNLSTTTAATMMPLHGAVPAKRRDLRLLLGVLGCPLAPVPLLNVPINAPLHIKDIPIETSRAHYIIQQYLAATGSLKQKKSIKNMYATGAVKMVCCETEVSAGTRGGSGVKTFGTRSGESGCFLVWQMSPGMWSLDLAVGGHNVIAGSNGKIVWRHTPWLGTHAAKGPQRPLRRIIQGLDPKCSASVFAKAQCTGEKRINDQDCFVLKVAADRAAVMERSEGPAEVIRHVLHGYFSQKSGLLVHMEDSHLTRVQSPGNDTVYWETTIESAIGDYRDVDGVMIAHQGRTMASVFRFGGAAMQHSRTRMEELWRIDDVVFNVPGLSIDYFIPPSDIFDALPSSPS